MCIYVSTTEKLLGNLGAPSVHDFDQFLFDMHFSFSIYEIELINLDCMSCEH